MNAKDPFDLRRFLEAQDPVFEEVCRELRAGRKQSHWMWFIFPQIAGLGSSAMAVRYAISSLQEAKAYLKEPILGPRLRLCTQLVMLTEGRSIEQIFGYPDDLKFHSSMTLFASASPDDEIFDAQIFKDALQKYFAGKPDQKTLDRL
jgi:uncharacterized protein (DUF1810 family)